MLHSSLKKMALAALLILKVCDHDCGNNFMLAICIAKIILDENLYSFCFLCANEYKIAYTIMPELFSKLLHDRPTNLNLDLTESLSTHFTQPPESESFAAQPRCFTARGILRSEGTG